MQVYWVYFHYSHKAKFQARLLKRNHAGCYIIWCHGILILNKIVFLIRGAECIL